MSASLIEPYYVPFFVDETQVFYQIETGSRQTTATSNATRHYLPRGAYLVSVAWSGTSGVKLRVSEDGSNRDITILPRDLTHTGDRQRAPVAVQFAISATSGGYITLQNDPATTLTGMGGRKLLLQIIPMPLYKTG